MKIPFNLKRSVSILILILFTFCTDDEPIHYKLTTLCTPDETGTVTPASGMFNEGTEVELKATPIQEYVFKNWEGDAVGNENPLKIIMLKDKNITAVFEKVNYSLNIEVIGEGTVNQEIVLFKSSSTDYPSGTTVKLTAVPDDEWEFTGWSGDHQSTENPLTLTVNNVINMTATFEIDNSEKTHIPDDNFEMALIDLGYDDIMDDYVKTIEISNVTSLDISDKNISNLKGLEDFKSLLNLDCSKNNISVVDTFFGSSFGEGFTVGTIILYDNNISSLDISALHCLGMLDVRNNPLTCIQVNENHLSCIEPSSLIQMIVKTDEGVTTSLDCGN